MMNKEKVLDLNDLSAENTKRLNQIADGLMSPYTLFIDDCCRKYGDNYLFWATPFASRNIFHDDTFLHLCRIRLVMELLEKGEIERIITETNGEYHTLKAVVGDKIEVIGPEAGRSGDRLIRCANRIRQYGRFFFRNMMYIICSDKTKKSYPEHMYVVIGFVTTKDFDGYVFRDNYTTDIEKYHSDVFFLPFIVNNGHLPNRKVFDLIRNCKSHRFIYDGRLLRLFDHIEIIKYWRFIRKIRKESFSFDGMDVSWLVRESLDAGKNNSSTFEGLIMRKMIHRLKDMGASVNSFIIWYEGQPKDILISSAIHNEFPNSACIGYQGRPLMEELPSEFISGQQYDSRYSPDCMAIPGRVYEKKAHWFCQTIPVIFAPILRNEYRIQKKNKLPKDKKRILLLLSIFEDVTKEEIVLIDEYLRNKKEYRVILKNHPTKNDYRIKDYGIENISFEPEFVTGKLGDCLKDVDVVVASSTASGLEILYEGIPLIIISPKGVLGFSAIPKELGDDMFYMVYGKEELKTALDNSLSKTSIQNEALEGMLVEKSDRSVGNLF